MSRADLGRRPARTRRAGSAAVRRRVAGSRRPVVRSRGVLAVDPDRRSTAVLVGVTLLALLVGTTAVVLGLLTFTAPGAFEPALG